MGDERIVLQRDTLPKPQPFEWRDGSLVCLVCGADLTGYVTDDAFWAAAYALSHPMNDCTWLRDYLKVKRGKVR